MNMGKHQRRATRVPNDTDPGIISKVPVDILIRTICNWNNIEPADLLSGSRKSDVREAKNLIAYFLTLREELFLFRICKLTGHKNHASVIHARNLVEDLMDVYPMYKCNLKLMFETLNLYTKKRVTHDFNILKRAV